MASIPMFVLGQGHTPLPLLSPEQGRALAQIILCDEARRVDRTIRGGHAKSPITGMFVSYSGKCKWRRESDLVERIYAAVELLKNSGLTDKEAVSEVAELLGIRIGKSKRGRPPKRDVPDDLVRRAQTVRSLCNSFRKRHPWKEALPKHDPVVERWFMYAVQLAAWSEEVSNINEAYFKEPKLTALCSVVRTISVCAEKLHGLYMGYSMPVGSARHVLALPHGWYPSSYLATKTD
jgi:hypothetical protein